MEVNKILSADVLDIVFEGRNKEYGAYLLRRTYSKRIKLALVATISAVALLLLLSSREKDCDFESPEKPDLLEAAFAIVSAR